MIITVLSVVEIIYLNLLNNFCVVVIDVTTLWNSFNTNYHIFKSAIKIKPNIKTFHFGMLQLQDFP